MKRIYFSLKTRLILNFSIVIFIAALLSVIIGMQMIGNTIIRQAQEKVRLDLNSAREVYEGEMFTIKNTLRLTAIRFFLKDEIIKKDRERLSMELQKIRERESLDILNLTDNRGNVIVRARSSAVYGDTLDRDVIRWVLAHQSDIVSTQLVPGELLEKEGKELADQARIKLISTPLAASKQKGITTEETSGMVISAAAPVFDYSNQLIGVLYGEKLLNRRCEIVDKVKDIVYRGQKYKGKDIGTVTIFQEGLRISTNVTNADGTRAIGTRVSQVVYQQVILKGIPWIDRAFVVRDWYITAYEPIKNLAGDIIGMLYVGILEAPYIELRNRVILNFSAVALLSLILLMGIGYFTAHRTVKPLKELMAATKKIARGELSHRVHIKSHDEIGQLAESFNQMTIDLDQLTRQYQVLNRTLEDRVKEKTRELKEAQDQLVQSEKLSSLGKMAAGVAHEINNPLTSILINAHLLAEQWENQEPFGEKGDDNLKVIIEETTRCSTIVKDLLQFSRQTAARKTVMDVNEVIEKTIALLKNQFRLNQVKINKNLDQSLPPIVIDMNKMEQVFMNIMINALDAMSGGGEISITSRLATNKNNPCLEIIFQDNGCGIPKQNIGKIFDPFFTTKSHSTAGYAGNSQNHSKGTGLGLSVTYGILQQHGGSIDIQSEEGKGTTVTIYLPIKEE